jgi:hypothetical protein
VTTQWSPNRKGEHIWSVEVFELLQLHNNCNFNRIFVRTDASVTRGEGSSLSFFLRTQVDCRWVCALTHMFDVWIEPKEKIGTQNFPDAKL